MLPDPTLFLLILTIATLFAFPRQTDRCLLALLRLYDKTPWRREQLEMMEQLRRDMQQSFYHCQIMQDLYREEQRSYDEAVARGENPPDFSGFTREERDILMQIVRTRNIGIPMRPTR